jgi:preprotein translocase subunit SecD
VGHKANSRASAVRGRRPSGDVAVSDVQGFAYTLGLTTLIDLLVVFLFTKPMVTLLAGTRFFGGGHRWSGLDSARRGAKTPWRSSIR